LAIFRLNEKLKEINEKNTEIKDLNENLSKNQERIRNLEAELADKNLEYSK
jgi:chromosome segregation ATPase